jgi:hypothetical protein
MEVLLMREKFLTFVSFLSFWVITSTVAAQSPLASSKSQGSAWGSQEVISSPEAEVAQQPSTKKSLKAEIRPVYIAEPLADAHMVKTPQRDAPSFEIQLNDESVSLALRRWAWDTNYQLVWDAGKDFAARNTSYKAKTYPEAVEQVMADTEGSGYPLHACLYANRVVRVLHISQSCQRN